MARAISLTSGRYRRPCKGKSPWKNHQNGREQPHFFGLHPPKKFVGSLPPSGTVIRAECFFHGDRAPLAETLRLGDGCVGAQVATHHETNPRRCCSEHLNAIVPTGTFDSQSNDVGERFKRERLVPRSHGRTLRVWLKVTFPVARS
jgi:hypothetical protein